MRLYLRLNIRCSSIYIHRLMAEIIDRFDIYYWLFHYFIITRDEKETDRDKVDAYIEKKTATHNV